jgi:hypothetical protein
MEKLKDKDGGRVIIHELLARYVDALQDMCYQLAYTCDNPPRITTGGLSVLEDAFRLLLLGWDNPHPVSWWQCQYSAGCQKTATCGRPTPEGYKQLCDEHAECE